MELKDTIPMMTDPDYKERFRAEFFQLYIRMEKLGVVLKKSSKGTLDFVLSCPVELLERQYKAMLQLVLVMEERAEIENVDLSESVDLAMG